ncbi:MAG: hypothetical protein F4Z84_04675 [Gammaproteobacteria bacterium]|nr:hypothetical protein [Gammaproteobacteria bacterium]
MSSYKVIARNHSSAHENRIHSDDVAQKYGFKGALVPGVAVYGHLTRPLAERFGGDFLSRSIAALRLIKPAYDGDRLRIDLSGDDGQHLAECRNVEGTLLADLRVHMPGELPPPETPLSLSKRAKWRGRVEINWAAVKEGEPYPAWDWEINAGENQRFREQIADELELYDAHVHPHAILSIANQALTREFVMPAWIHTASEVRHRQALRVGDRVAVRAVPLEKWRRKGHEFVRLYIDVHRDQALTTEMFHTAIFKVAA